MSRAERIEELASLWVVRREEPEWSANDQADLDQWLAESDAHKVAFWRLEQGWREDRLHRTGDPQLDPGLQLHLDQAVRRSAGIAIRPHRVNRRRGARQLINRRRYPHRWSLLCPEVCPGTMV